MYVDDEILKRWLRLMNDCGIENLTSEEHQFLDNHVDYVEELVIDGLEPNATWVRESRDHWLAYYQGKRHQNPFFGTV